MDTKNYVIYDQIKPGNRRETSKRQKNGRKGRKKE